MTAATHPGASIEFWFEFASTYTYPAAMRIESLAEAGDIAVLWRPFLLGPIFRQQGLSDSPFNLNPAKGRYMWRDLERTCDAAGIPFRRPTVFPRNGLLAARVACCHESAPWLPAFVRTVFHANFAEDRDIADPRVVGECLAQAGADPVRMMATAATGPAKEALRRQTERAVSLGIFGAPSFIAAGELFWGNDRLEIALSWSAERAGRS